MSKINYHSDNVFHHIAGGDLVYIISCSGRKNTHFFYDALVLTSKTIIGWIILNNDEINECIVL
jgi:hypothetical protein